LFHAGLISCQNPLALEISYPRACIICNLLGAVWAIAGLGWDADEKIASDGSQPSVRYRDEGFDEAWATLDRNYPDPIGIGSVLKPAKHRGLSIAPFAVCEGYCRCDELLA
jgi:hypothetical protein